MADQTQEVKNGQLSSEQNVGPHKKLLDDTSFTRYVGTATDDNNKLSGLTSTAGGRQLYALGEGISMAPHGMWNELEHDYTHPWEAAGKVAGATAFGIGMRTLLPEAGAARAIVGTAMTYFMVADLAKPLTRMLNEASGAKDMLGVHNAASTLGDGLGKFGVDTGVGIGFGMLGEAGTGAILRGTASGRSFDAWKDAKWGVGKNADVAPSIAGTENTTGTAAESLLASRKGMPFDQKMAAIREAGQNGSMVGPLEPSQVDVGLVNNLQGKLDVSLKAEKVYRSHEFSTKIDDLLSNTDVAAAEAAAKPGSGMLTEAQQAVRNMTGDATGEPLKTVGTTAGEQIPFQPGDGAKTGDTTKAPTGQDTTIPTTTGDQTGTTSTEAKTPTDAKTPTEAKAPTTDATIAPTDAVVGPPRKPGEMSAEDLGKMAVAVRTEASKWTKQDMQIAQAKEDVAGPLIGTMREGKAPLDQGHFNNNQMLLDLNGQIKTLDDARQALPLLDHFRTANQQLEIAHSGDGHGLSQINHLNQYARSIQAFMLGRLDALGIPRDVIRGSNAPLFSIRDSDGAGPYTIPAIKGVSDAAVVNYPREYSGMEGVHVPGVYPHELGHDLVFGDLLRFPAELRDKILTEDVIGAAMKKAGIEDTIIEVPGSPNGTMKKSEFFAALLKAEANENTADMFGTSIDPNTGLSLAVLLGSLRKPAGDPRGPGSLETRSMYGNDFVDANMGNTLGIEPHGIDRWRIKLTAQTLREISGGDKSVNAHADQLDSMATAMSRPGDQYVWANMDQQGKFVAIPQKEWDAIIPHLVKAQLDTPLEALQGHRLRDLSPNMVEVFKRVDTLSTSMAEAALKSSSTVEGFDKANYHIEDVFSAGLSGWRKAVELNAAQGNKIPADVLMARINKLSEGLRAHYVDDVPEAALTGATTEATHSTAKPADAAIPQHGFMAKTTGRVQEAAPGIIDFASKWGAPTTFGYAGARLGGSLGNSVQDLMEHKKIQDAMLSDQTKPGE